MGVHSVLHRCIYLKIKGNNKGALSREGITALITTLLISGSLHEFTIYSQVGYIRGNQIMFFGLQGVGIIIEGFLTPFMRFRQIFGRIYLFSYLFLTLPFFFSEIGKPMTLFLSNDGL